MNFQFVWNVSLWNIKMMNISKVGAIAFDPYTHGFYKVGERVGNAFKDGFKLKNK